MAPTGQFYRLLIAILAAYLRLAGVSNFYRFSSVTRRRIRRRKLSEILATNCSEDPIRFEIMCLRKPGILNTMDLPHDDQTVVVVKVL